ncbi:hypothetical protein HGG75_26030 [Ochrobactrum pseudogrignonense]|nr:hypothetical protein [Brucella pseudogrignonensis]
MSCRVELSGDCAIRLSGGAAVLGQERTSAIIAWLLQRIAGIQSAGGYLRFLLNKARISDLSVSKLLLMDPVKQMQTTMCR